MNKISGTIQQVNYSDEFSQLKIEAKGILFTALIITPDSKYENLEKGQEVIMIFKESDLHIGKDLSVKFSVLNRIPATVQAVEKNKLLSRIQMDFQGQQLYAMIPSESLEYLSLVVGEEIEAFVRANEIMLIR